MGLTWARSFWFRVRHACSSIAALAASQVEAKETAAALRIHEQGTDSLRRRYREIEARSAEAEARHALDLAALEAND